MSTRVPDPGSPYPFQEERVDQHPMPISRRRFLERSALAIAGGVLFSCTGGKRVPTVSESSPATRIDTQWPIKQVIYLMLENRSFDNLFGKFPGVNGATVGVLNGREKPLIPCPDWLPGDLGHDHISAIVNLNEGKLDGFGIGAYGDPWAYSQFDAQQIPAYWHWASEYALSDNFFASAFGPSFPNHFFFVAGTSGGVFDNPENIGTRPDPDTQGQPGGDLFKSWGCDAVGHGEGDEGVFVFTMDEKGHVQKHDTCVSFPTVGEQLTSKGVDWSFYSPPPGVLGYMWNSFNGIGNVFHSDQWHEHCVHNIDDLVADIKADRLPAVTWAVPHFQLSDHPPASTSFTHNWVMDIVNAVMTGPMWQHTAIFLTWDEWGGFYDHVIPPKIDPVGLGYRVPLITISPFTPRGLLDSEVGEFSTPLRFIADNWGLAHISPRIENTHDMSHMFDFRSAPREPVLATKRAKTYGNPYEFPKGYPGWPRGTIPVDNPF
jgi:phospholipase C